MGLEKLQHLCPWPPTEPLWGLRGSLSPTELFSYRASCDQPPICYEILPTELDQLIVTTETV
jgi:hypothetical protein